MEEESDAFEVIAREHEFGVGRNDIRRDDHGEKITKRGEEREQQYDEPFAGDKLGAAHAIDDILPVGAVSIFVAGEHDDDDGRDNEGHGAPEGERIPVSGKLEGVAKYEMAGGRHALESAVKQEDDTGKTDDV
jgi:hypothetical protein